MMIPKEKAEELYDKYSDLLQYELPALHHKEEIKKCAIITVDEIIKDFKSYRVKYWLTLESAIELSTYWEGVKTEIEKL